MEALNQVSLQSGFKKFIEGKEQDYSSFYFALLSFSSLKETLGAQWDTKKDAVIKLIETVIAKHSLTNDVYSAFGEEGFFVGLKREKKQEAQLVTQIIAQEVTKRLFGEASNQKAAIKVVPVKNDKNTVRFDQEKALLFKELNFDIDPKNILFIYRPMWAAKLNKISTFTCLPVFQDIAGSIIVGNEFLRLKKDARLSLIVDIALLQKAIHDLRILAQKKRNLILSVPVHLTTIVKLELWSQFIEVCRKIKNEKSHIIFEILIPEGTPPIQVAGAVKFLKPFCRATIGRTSVDANIESEFKDTGLTAIGIDIGQIDGDEREIIEKLEAFAEKANKVLLRTYVHGLKALSLTMASICAGYDYVDGDMVTSVIDSPVENYHFKISDLYKTLLKNPV